MVVLRKGEGLGTERLKGFETVRKEEAAAAMEKEEKTKKNLEKIRRCKGFFTRAC